MSPKSDYPFCRRCAKPIQGAYIQALDFDWHPACWVCGGCGKPLEGRFVVERGQGWHDVCHEAEFALRCSLCSGVIQGTYFMHEGAPVCERDYLAKVVPRCAVCGDPLMDGFSRNDWGQKVCSQHQDDPRCTSCGRWLGVQERVKGLFETFGTTLCTHCHSRAITDKALGAYGNAFGGAALGELGLLFPQIPPVRLRLDTATQIQRLHGDGGRDVEGVTLTEVRIRNGVEEIREVKEIVVWGGLAREHFEGILAHEFGHVWLFHGGFDHPRGSQATEGFCELVRIFWMRRLGTPLARDQEARRLASKDPLYGEGLRRFQALIERGGMKAVLDVLRNG